MDFQEVNISQHAQWTLDKIEKTFNQTFVGQRIYQLGSLVKQPNPGPIS